MAYTLFKNKFILTFQKVLDMVKIDIEGAEWPALKQILSTHSMKYVKQLIVEIHTPVFRGGEMTVEDYTSIYNDLAELRDVWGFRLYMEHHNIGCCRSFTTLTPAKMINNKHHLCCYELHFINSNYH